MKTNIEMESMTSKMFSSQNKMNINVKHKRYQQSIFTLLTFQKTWWYSCLNVGDFAY